jgi:hypothetical protein
MSFIGIIGMNSRYEAEIQILTSSMGLFIFISMPLALMRISECVGSHL